MEFVLFWILCGIVAAVIASSKGRSGCGWFILGALFGPFGIIFAFLASKNEESMVQAGEMKKCPYCAELVRAEAIKCRYCGSDLT